MKYVAISLFILTASCCIQKNNPPEKVIIMSWNVQNLFDGKDDGSEYGEYSVKDGLWSDSLYKTRLKALTKIMELNSPDIIGFQEIEGEDVLKDISNLLDDYPYYVSTSTDSAIQQGVLSRFPITGTGLIEPYGENLRPILEVYIDIDGSELILINNHWKSKLGGFSENLRIASSSALKKRLKELYLREVVVLGDFNENYNEYQRIGKSYKTALLYNVSGTGITVTDGRPENDELYTPWPDSGEEGSYLYKGSWETIDNFFLNPNLMDREGFFFTGFRVDRRSTLFNRDGSVKKWNGDFKTGYSDHLPIILELEREGIKTSLE